VAAKEQAEGIEQVNRAVAEMDKVTQQTAATAEESASTAAELNAQAEELTKASVSLLSFVDGTAEGESPHHSQLTRLDRHPASLPAPVRKGKPDHHGKHPPKISTTKSGKKLLGMGGDF